MSTRQKTKSLPAIAHQSLLESITLLCGEVDKRFWEHRELETAYLFFLIFELEEHLNISILDSWSSITR